MKFGIIRERKNPPDRRVVLSPSACQKVVSKFSKAEIIVEPSPIRAYSDEVYEKAGLEVASKMDECDVLLGVKEVPIKNLIPNKKYFFFSHTIKKQPYNRNLLRAILDKNIELYDHEVITNENEQRLVAFGYRFLRGTIKLLQNERPLLRVLPISRPKSRLCSQNFKIVCLFFFKFLK